MISQFIYTICEKVKIKFRVLVVNKSWVNIVECFDRERRQGFTPSGHQSPQSETVTADCSYSSYCNSCEGRWPEPQGHVMRWPQTRVMSSLPHFTAAARLSASLSPLPHTRYWQPQTWDISTTHNSCSPESRVRNCEYGTHRDCAFNQ